MNPRADAGLDPPPMLEGCVTTLQNSKTQGEGMPHPPASVAASSIARRAAWCSGHPVGAHRRADWYPPRSLLGPDPVIHGGTVRDVETGRQAAWSHHPSDLWRTASGTLACGGGSQLSTQTSFNQDPKRRSRLHGAFLGADQKIIRKIDRGLHTGNHKAIFPYSSSLSTPVSPPGRSK